MENKEDIFSRDPATLMQYVYKSVEMTTSDGKVHEGWVYTVDPVSQSFVLLHLTDKKKREPNLKTFEIILGHSIQSVIITDEGTSLYKDFMDKLFKHSADSEQISEIQMVEKRQAVKKWLEDNRVPVELWTEDEHVLTVNNVLFIHPPYKPENCISTNEIILHRIQKLLSSCKS